GPAHLGRPRGGRRRLRPRPAVALDRPALLADRAAAGVGLRPDERPRQPRRSLRRPERALRRRGPGDRLRRRHPPRPGQGPGPALFGACAAGKGCCSWTGRGPGWTRTATTAAATRSTSPTARAPTAARGRPPTSST